MLTSIDPSIDIDVQFIFDSVCLGFSSSANILQIGDVALRVMLFLTNEPAKKTEINILTARDTTGPGF